MKKRNMIMAVLAIITMGLAIPLGAQTIFGVGNGVGTLASNTNVATAGLFKNDVDNFVDYHKYSGVLKDTKWFGFLTGRTSFDGALDAGYASNFGGIYLGTWYRGNIFRSTNITHETKTITPQYDDVLGILNQRTDTTTYREAYNETANNIEFLIGVAGMGIKVGFFESTSSNKNEGNPNRNVQVVDYLDGRKEYSNAIDEYTKTQSYLRPYLGWGGTFPVAAASIRPYVDIGFGIFNDTQIDNYSDFTEVNGRRQNVVKTVGEGHNNGYLLPNGRVGAWLDIASKDTVLQSIGLSYAISLSLYANDADGLGSVDGIVSWGQGYINMATVYTDRTVTTTDITYTINERTNISHTITPAYKITGEPAENFKLGFSATVPVAFSSSSSDQYTRRIQRTAVKNNNGIANYVTDTNTLTYAYNGNTETSTLRVNLNLAVGASYQLIPKRFGINAGVLASPVRYLQTVNKQIPRTTETVTTVKRTEQDGSVTQNTKTVTLKTESDQVSESSVWQQYTGDLYGGFTFNFNDHAALDLAVNSYGGNSFWLNIADINVIFTLKY